MIYLARKSTPRFTKSPSVELIRLVLTEIQRFKNAKIKTEMYGNPDAVFRPPHREHAILLSMERVNKRTKKMKSLPFSPLVIS